MTTLQLACRVYAINPEVRNDITELLIKSAPNKPRSYDVYHTEEQDIDLAIVILRRFDNSYGTNITVSIDQILNLYHREEHEKPVRYSKE
ncbi:MAG TPA: hypothetical protein VFI70_13360, partial [Nitrososphaeraceae archaeon]|nr:hypothetical protein [Nitrososphaeraceae archaeon]